MNQKPGVQPEHYSTVPVKGTAIVHAAGGTLQRGRIRNLGRGGLFVTTRNLDREIGLDRIVDVEIRLDGGHNRWLRTPGQVVRIDDDGLAIAFVNLPDAWLHVIDEAATASRTRSRVMSVVLFDNDANRRASMATAFRNIGCQLIEASTPLEAVVRLGEASFEPDLIAIADSIPAAVAGELRSFVERRHPSVKLVTIGNTLIDPGEVLNWLSAAGPDLTLSRRILELIARPHQAQRRVP